MERENTVPAFRAAVAIGADGVELDVRRTADGALVVHHDPSLPDGRAIRNIAFADKPDELPTLQEALDACDGLWVNVEIKNDPREPDFDPSDSIADDTVACLAQRGEPQRWLISSFRMETIDRCRVLAPDLRTAWLTTFVPDDVVEVLTGKGHSALHPWVGMLERDTIDRCHAAGLHVNGWTCNDPARIRELAEWGIDGLCTDVPDVALAVLAELDASR